MEQRLTRHRIRSLGRLAAAAAAAWCLTPTAARAQSDVEAIGRALGGAKPPPAFYEIIARHPRAFRFAEDDGWVRKGREISARRGAMRSHLTQAVALAQRAHTDVNGILVGDLNVPAFLIAYADTDLPTLMANVPRSELEAKLFGTAAAPPYSVHTYYLEISGDSLRVNGTVLDWTVVAQNGTYYEGSGNGLGGDSEVHELIEEMVAAHDAALDYGQFDNDGPDGVPNSGDDDGFVDAIVLLHPEVDGACGNVYPAAAPNIWAHRWVYSGWTSVPLETADDVNGGGAKIKVNNYIIQGGQGGDGGCTPDEAQAPGLIAHETGHLLGLPDLYNTAWQTRDSEGIGHWGLMGSGNWNTAGSPAHMEAWSRAELGWVSEVLLASDTTIDIQPVELSDTAYIVPIPGTSEYYLLENRQKIGSDVDLHERGLLVWHVDSTLLSARAGFNTVNAADPEALWLVQADGANGLQLGTNRGDAGDPFPGSTSNVRFSFDTDPATLQNNSTHTEITFDLIEQLDPGSPWGAVRVRVTQSSAPTLVLSPTSPTDGVMGTSYSDTLEASGGIGAYIWQVISGALPEGLTLGSTTGILQGTPAETGSFAFEAQVTSGSQTQSAMTSLDVTAPTLVMASVLDELLGVSQTLTDDELEYLDLLGNRNGGFDVGDFHAWVDSGDAPLTAMALAERLAELRGVDR